MQEERWPEACPKLEESERLDPGKGTEFNLADCYEHTGRVTSAWILFTRVVAESHESNLVVHETLARQRADALALRVPHLVVDVPVEARVEGLEILRDGESVRMATWSTPVPLDPGEHIVIARAPHRRPFQVSAVLSEGGDITVHIPTLEELPPEPPSPPAPPQAGDLPKDGVVRPPSVASGAAGTKQRTVGIVLGAAGLTSFVVGGIFGGLSIAARDDSKKWCDPSTDICTSDRGVQARSDALTRGNVATGFVIAGGALLSAGVVVWLLAPSPAGPQVGVQAQAGLPRVIVGGTF